MSETSGGQNPAPRDETTSWTTPEAASGEPMTDTASTGLGHGSGFESPYVSPAGDAGRSEGGREWVGQLQGMIDNLATQAAPMLREIGAKAAELAAAAGEKAGPIAHKAAGATEAAGHKLAERGREVASDLRRGEAGTGEGAAAGDVPNTIEPGSTTTATGYPDTSSSYPDATSTYPSDTTRTVGE